MKKFAVVQIPEGYVYQRVETKGKEAKVIFAKIAEKAYAYIKTEDLSESDFGYEPKTDWQRKGKSRIFEALKNKPECGGFYTTTYEVSESEDGTLQSVPDAIPAVGKSCSEAKKLAEKFDPERGSRLGTVNEYFLVIARLIKDGVITWEQAFDDSKDVGNYWTSSDSPKEMEKTGSRWTGEISNFIGNTIKIVSDEESRSGFSLAGGSFYYYGNIYPAGDVFRYNYPFDTLCISVLWVVLSK